MPLRLLLLTEWANQILCFLARFGGGAPSFIYLLFFVGGGCHFGASSFPQRSLDHLGIWAADSASKKVQ